MKTVNDVIEELNRILTNFGNLPVAVTEEIEEGKPLSPLASVTIVEGGIKDWKTDQWIDGKFDSICVISASGKYDVINRLTENL